MAKEPTAVVGVPGRTLLISELTFASFFGLLIEEQSTSDTVVRGACSQQLPAISSPQTPVASRPAPVENCETRPNLFAEE